MWGLTACGAITVNVMNETNNNISATSTSALPLNAWTHVAQTYSPTNGNRLYINGILVASVSIATGYPVGPYTIIGASPVNTTYCYAGSIATGQFYGMVDEYRVFGVELTSTDVCRLANP
jgi:hypothetical protein